MKKINKYLLVIILSFIIAIAGVSAKNYIKGLFQFDDNLEIKERLEGTAFLAGDKITIEETIDGIGFIVGNDIKINKNQDYIFGLGINVNIKGNIEKDLFLAGETINIKSIVNRDAYIYGTNIDLEGDFNRNIYIYGSNIKLKGNFKGNVVISSINIEIDEETNIEGILKYNNGALIEGLNESIKTKTYETKTMSFKEYTLNFISSYLHIVIVALVIVFINESILKKSLDQTKELNLKKLFTLSLKGLLILIGVPIIATMLLFSNLFVSLGIIGAIIYGIIIYISNIFTGYFIANLIDKKYLHKNMNNYLLVIMGLLIITIIRIIPIVGGLIYLLCTLIGIGIIGNMLIELKK